MIILKLGWKHLLKSEKIILVFSAALGILLAYVAVRDGYGIISNQGLGPLVLSWLACHSLFLVGIMRMRSFALNHVFVETLNKLREAQGVIPKDIDELIARFLGDKK